MVGVVINPAISFDPPDQADIAELRAKYPHAVFTPAGTSYSLKIVDGVAYCMFCEGVCVDMGGYKNVQGKCVPRKTPAVRKDWVCSRCKKHNHLGGGLSVRTRRAA